MSKDLIEYYNVGVVGFSAQKFDTELAKKHISEAFDIVEEKAKGETINCISGYTDLGIPALAYREAVKRGWKTTGVACEKAEAYDVFDVDHKFIVGKEWGDESQKFLSLLAVLIRIGGGKQSFEEVEKAKKMEIPVLEYDL